MRKENVTILILFTLFLYCYDLILIMTLADFMGMVVAIFYTGFESIFGYIYEFFFKPHFFSNIPPGMPIFIWSMFFITIVIFYIFSVIKYFVNYKIKIFISIKIINIGLIPFWIINYFFIFHYGLNASFLYLSLFNPGGFITIVFLVGINYIFQILVSLPSILYINFLYKNHSMKIIWRVVHTILQFILVLGLFDNIYLIIKYRKYTGKANVA